VNEPNLTAIRATMEAAAQTVATLSPDLWPGWVVYLLEALQERTTADRYRAMLRDVAGDIVGYLEAGRW
jgi:hypothetical protein